MKISEMLAGGNPRTLGKTEEVIKLVLAQRALLNELFNCLFLADEVVRMRASDALEKICRQKTGWLVPYKEKLLNEVPKIRQASVQWHLAQILSEIELSPREQARAITLLKNNLQTMDDWIVTNLTLESLATFARKKALNHEEFVAILGRYQQSNHKSVVSRSNKLLNEFTETSNSSYPQV